MTVLGHADRGAFTKTRAGACDEDGLGHDLAPIEGWSNRQEYRCRAQLFPPLSGLNLGVS
jgi:hypothetical protein